MRSLVDRPPACLSPYVLGDHVLAGEIEKPDKPVAFPPSTLRRVVLVVEAKLRLAVAMLGGPHSPRSVQAEDSGISHVGRNEEDGGQPVAAERSICEGLIRQRIFWLDIQRLDEATETLIAVDLVTFESYDGTIQLHTQVFEFGNACPLYLPPTHLTTADYPRVGPQSTLPPRARLDHLAAPADLNTCADNAHPSRTQGGRNLVQRGARGREGGSENLDPSFKGFFEILGLEGSVRGLACLLYLHTRCGALVRFE
jgi:hypothetical protein